MGQPRILLGLGSCCKSLLLGATPSLPLPAPKLPLPSPSQNVMGLTPESACKSCHHACTIWAAKPGHKGVLGGAFHWLHLSCGVLSPMRHQAPPSRFPSARVFLFSLLHRPCNSAGKQFMPTRLFRQRDPANICFQHGKCAPGCSTKMRLSGVLSTSYGWGKERKSAAQMSNPVVF